MAKREVLVPIEREDIPFHNHTITAVKLSDNRIAVVLSWVCEALELHSQGQAQRIERTPSIADELVIVKVLAKRGGMQDMLALTLRGFPTWILGIHPSELKGDNPEKAERIRQMILAYQVEAVDVLYNHFAQKGYLALPESSTIVPAEPVKPSAPQPDAPHDEWIIYYQQMARWHQQLQDIEVRMQKVEQRQDNTEARVGSLEKIVGSMLPRVGGLSTEHRATAQEMVKQISKISRVKPQYIWSDLKKDFHAPTYSDIPDEKWADVQKWLQRRLDSTQRGKGIEQQPSLFTTDDTQDE
jgi:hypothetical protein